MNQPCRQLTAAGRFFGNLMTKVTVYFRTIRSGFNSRDGFENLYEFCAECFMASELTDKIGLANEFRELLKRVI